MPDNKGLVPLNGKHLPYGFPDGVVKRALLYCMESGSVALGHRRLKAELELGGMPVPDYHTTWTWVKQSEECYQAVTGPNKREMGALFEDATRCWGERMIEASESDKLAPTQVGINYGISADKVIGLYKVGQSGPTQAVQINITSGGEKIREI